MGENGWYWLCNLISSDANCVVTFCPNKTNSPALPWKWTGELFTSTWASGQVSSERWPSAILHSVRSRCLWTLKCVLNSQSHALEVRVLPTEPQLTLLRRKVNGQAKSKLCQASGSKTPQGIPSQFSSRKHLKLSTGFYLLGVWNALNIKLQKMY